MKKIFLSMLLIAGFALSSEAQKTKYYYYPGANVYYDVANKQYIYNAGNTWTTASALPTGVAVAGKRRVIMYNDGRDIWQNNQLHTTKYKAKATHLPKGKAVGYKGSNPNKASGKLKAKKH